MFDAVKTYLVFMMGLSSDEVRAQITLFRFLCPHARASCGSGGRSRAADLLSWMRLALETPDLLILRIASTFYVSLAPETALWHTFGHRAVA